MVLEVFSEAFGMIFVGILAGSCFKTDTAHVAVKYRGALDNLLSGICSCRPECFSY